MTAFVLILEFHLIDYLVNVATAHLLCYNKGINKNGKKERLMKKSPDQS